METELQRLARAQAKKIEDEGREKAIHDLPEWTRRIKEAISDGSRSVSITGTGFGFDESYRKELQSLLGEPFMVSLSSYGCTVTW